MATREADLGDVDMNDDLDILLANVRSSVAGADPANRLLLNDGAEVFSDGGEAAGRPSGLRAADPDARRRG